MDRNTRFRSNLAAAQVEAGIKTMAVPKPNKQYDQFVISSLQSFAYAARTFNSLDPEAKARVFKDIPPASIHACNRCVTTLMRMLSKQTGDTTVGRRNSAGNTFDSFSESAVRDSSFSSHAVVRSHHYIQGSSFNPDSIPGLRNASRKPSCSLQRSSIEETKEELDSQSSLSNSLGTRSHNEALRTSSSDRTLSEYKAEQEAAVDSRRSMQAIGDVRRAYLQVIAKEVKTLRVQVTHAEQLRLQWGSNSAAYNYTPSPVRVTAMALPPGMNEVAASAAAGMHHYWVQSRIATGWRYAEHHDELAKKDPRLVPFARLEPQAREMNLTQAQDCIKLIVALGHRIVKANRTKSISNKATASIKTRRAFLAGGPKLVREGSGFIALNKSSSVGKSRAELEKDGGSDAQNAQGDDDLSEWDELIDMIACQSHEVWALNKQRAGYIYGITRNDGEDGEQKTHPEMVPFCVLTDDAKKYDRTTSEQLVRAILGAGYKISDPEAGSSGIPAQVLLLPSDIELTASSAGDAAQHHARATLMLTNDQECELDLDMAVEAIGEMRPELDPADIEMANVMRFVNDGARLKKIENAMRRRREAGRARGVTTGIGWLMRFKEICVEKFKSLQFVLFHPREAFSTVIHPGCTYMICWNMMILCLVLYSGVTVPVQLGFATTDSMPQTVVSVIVELIFLCDVLQNFRVGFHDPTTNALVQDTRLISRKYLSGWFWADIAGSIPVEIIELTSVNENSDLGALKVVRILKIMRLVRLLRLKVLDDLVKLIGKPSLIRLLKYFIMLIGAMHLVACVYAAINRIEEEKYARDSGYFHSPSSKILTASGLEWETRRWRIVATQPFALQYATAFYWSALAFLGSDMYPTTEDELWLAIVSAVVGLAVVSTIIGSFSSTLTSLDAVSEEQQATISRVSSYMRLRSVPPHLQSQVYDFFEYVHRTGALRPDALMHQLPPSLTVQLEMALKANLLLQNPMFENISQGATAALVRRLSTTVVVPDQVIICAGYPGECMYFVQSGNLVYFEEVSGLVQIFDAIDNHQYFGSEAFFSEGHVHTRSVKSTSHCILEALHFDDLIPLMEMYDDIKEQVQLIAQEFDEGILEFGRSFKSKKSERVQSRWETISGNRPRLKEPWLPVVMDEAAKAEKAKKAIQYSAIVDKTVKSWKSSRKSFGPGTLKVTPADSGDN